MSKNQELQRLEQFIASLPKDSYLRPWLEDVKPQVESEIRSDFMVSPSLTVTRTDCESLKATTRANCTALFEAAQREADRIITTARDDARRLKARACDRVRAALSELEN